MPRRETIAVTLPDDSVVDVVLRSSNIGDASYHTQLIIDGNSMKYDGTQATSSKKNIGTYMYPHCVACVESPESIRNIPLDQFMLLDEVELDRWSAASDRLNHHWWQAQSDRVSRALRKINEDLSAEAQKKTGTPLSGSPTSTTVTPPVKKTSRHLKT